LGRRILALIVLSAFLASCSGSKVRTKRQDQDHWPPLTIAGYVAGGICIAAGGGLVGYGVEEERDLYRDIGVAGIMVGVALATITLIFGHKY
jgi:hypothetical protein